MFKAKRLIVRKNPSQTTIQVISLTPICASINDVVVCIILTFIAVQRSIDFPANHVCFFTCRRMAFLTAKQLSFIFGLLGNIVSFLVFLAPVPTFYKIYKKKTSDGFQAIPYSVALFSASMLLYYASLQSDKFMIVSINIIGCVIEVAYLTMYIVYASRAGKISALRMIFLLNIGSTGLVVLLTMLLAKGPSRVTAVGWICAAVNLAVFAAPLSIMRRVIQTRSVEFMPFNLSFFLTLCATMWFFYGVFVKDFFIAVPNVVGFILGISQMLLYIVYRYVKKNPETTLKQHEETKERPLCLNVDSETKGLELKGIICKSPDEDDHFN